MSNQQAAPTLDPVADPCTVQGGRYLTFVLSGQAYGIPILCVREIIAFQDITPVPSVPSYVEGVINLRGRIIPVIDLGKRLGFDTCARSDRTCIIVTEVEADDDCVIQMGCIVDTVSEVMPIGGDQIECPPKLGPGVDLDSIMGVAKVGEAGSVVSLLEINQVLGSLDGASL